MTLLFAHEACIELHDHVIILYNISFMKEKYDCTCIISAILNKWVPCNEDPIFVRLTKASL